MLAPQAKRSAFGRKRAENVISFIVKLTVPSGTGQGKPFKLQTWLEVVPGSTVTST